MEDTSLQESLQQAPPNAPTAADAEAAKATEAARTASMLSEASGHSDLQLAQDIDKTHPNTSHVLPETPVAPDIQHAPGSMADKMMKAGANLHSSLMGAFSQPEAKAPGGLTKALFSGVNDALRGGGDWGAAQSNADATQPTRAPMQMPKKNFGSNIFNALRDAQALNTNPNAISDRKRQEMTDQITMAHANSEMLHDQMLVHKLGEDAIGASVETGKQGYEAILNANQPGTKVAEGKDSDEIKQMIDSKQINPSVDTVFLTGRKVTGKDANGLPLYRSTYSVITPHGPVNLTGKDDVLDKIEKYTGTDLRSKDGEKVTEVPAVQFNQLYQQMSTAETLARAARVSEAGDAKNRKTIDEAQNSDAGNKMLHSNTLAKVVGGVSVPSKDGTADPHALVKAYNYLMTHPEDQAKVMKETGASNFSSAFMDYAGGREHFDKLTEEFAKARAANVDNSTSMLDKIEKNPESMVGKTDALIPVLEAMVKNPSAYETDPAKVADLKKRAIDQLAIVKEVAAHELQSSIDKEAGKQKAQNEAELGDVDELIEAAKRYDLDPEKQFGNRAGMRAAFMNKFLKETGTQWKEGEYLARKKTIDDFRPAGKSGTEVRSLNTFAGHVGIAVDRIPELNNSASPDWNTAMNKIATKVGDEQYGRMRQALEAVKDGYLDFLKSQHAPTKEELERAESILNANASPHQLHGIMAQMADTVAIRGGQLQRSYTKQMDRAYDSMLDPDSDRILQNLGVDTNKMKGLPSAPQGAASKTGGKAADGTPVWPMVDGSIQDSNGNKYDSKTGRRIPTPGQS